MSARVMLPADMWVCAVGQQYAWLSTVFSA